MKRIVCIYVNFFVGLFSFIALFFGGCTHFLEIDPPNSKISKDLVFKNDGTANAAILGVYSRLFQGYGNVEITKYTGLSSDELAHFGTVSPPKPNLLEFYENQLTPNNVDVAALWRNMYAVIYGANSILSQIEGNNKISEPLLRRLEGEARFLRAFTYFYLVNLFGDVPLILTIDPNKNAMAGLTSQVEVNRQIDQDLKVALNLLDESYSEKERVRVNRVAVAAFYARFNLYQGNWEIARQLSSYVIGKNEYCVLEKELDQVFLVNSREAIWQCAKNTLNTNSGEASVFLLIDDFVASNELLSWFSVEDRRRQVWFHLKDRTRVHWVPYKYKVTNASITVEHSIILRLAEQYLIRAEALSQIGDLNNAISDLNVIRQRAGINSIIGQPSQADLLEMIILERGREFFAEWGNRWLDLKRTGRAKEVLKYVKGDFDSPDEWYPIPENEQLKNPNLKK